VHRHEASVALQLEDSLTSFDTPNPPAAPPRVLGLERTYLQKLMKSYDIQ